MTELERLQRSIDGILGRERIRDLVHRYSMAVDDRDIDAIADCFTTDGCFEHADGTLRLEGRAAVLDYYNARLRFLGPSYHYPHSHLIELDGDTATGVVCAHAELGFPDGRTFWVALRYYDRYACDAGGTWRFSARRVSFLYYLPLSDLATALAEPLRKRASLPHRPADWPEGLATWQAYLGVPR